MHKYLYRRLDRSIETKLERNIEREIKRGGSYDSRGRIVIIKVVYYVIIFKCKTEMNTNKNDL